MKKNEQPQEMTYAAAMAELESILAKMNEPDPDIDSLAQHVNMSTANLHRRFKLLTGLSPLQYQKQLRLHEARRLMLFENERVSDAAFTVGYESITQFNREYKRIFGEPPLRDTNRRRAASGL